MKKIFFAFLTMLLMTVLSSSTTPENTNSELSAEDLAGIEAAFEQMDKAYDNNPRGTVTRKGVKYKWELRRPTKSGRYQISITKESKGKANLVLSSNIIILNKQAQGQGTVVKMFYATPNSYQWTMDKNTYLKVSFLNGQEKIEAKGKMSSFERNDLSYTEAQYKAKIKPNPNYKNTTVRYVSATMRYLIFKYPKMVKG